VAHYHRIDNSLNMDDLAQLMQQIDLNSKVIPEGSYLEMCKQMKNIYETLQKVQPRAVNLPARNQGPVPFQPIFDDDDDDDDDDFILQRIDREFEREVELENQLRELSCKIMTLTNKRAKFSPWVKMSAGRKKEAIKERAEQLDIRLTTYTLEALRNKGVIIRDEKRFFTSFMERKNLLLRETYNELTEEIEDYIEEENRLRIELGDF